MAKKSKKVVLDFSKVSDSYYDIILDEGPDYIVIDFEGKPYIIEDIERHRDEGYLYQDSPLSETEEVEAYPAKKVIKEVYEKA